MFVGGTEDDVPKPKIEDTQARKQDQMPTTTARYCSVVYCNLLLKVRKCNNFKLNYIIVQNWALVLLISR